MTSRRQLVYSQVIRGDDACRRLGLHRQRPRAFRLRTLAVLVLSVVAGCKVTPVGPNVDDNRPADRHSVLLKIKKCLAPAPQGNTERSSCRMPNAASVLSGISQAEIISVLGPPTWCRGTDGAVTHNRQNCSENQKAGWSFSSQQQTNSGEVLVGGELELVCEPGKNLICGQVYWIASQ